MGEKEKKKVSLTIEEYERAEFLKLLIKEADSPTELKRHYMELMQIYHKGHIRYMKNQLE